MSEDIIVFIARVSGMNQSQLNLLCEDDDTAAVAFTAFYANKDITLFLDLFVWATFES